MSLLNPNLTYPQGIAMPLLSAVFGGSGSLHDCR